VDAFAKKRRTLIVLKDTVEIKAAPERIFDFFVHFVEMV
jgi:hypothetical protein